MGRRRLRKKQATLERATPMVLPGSGGLIYVPPGALQSTQGQVFYGSSTKNVATGQSALFSPGIPLAPQNNVNPGGYPIAWKFPVAANTFPVDRTLGMPDIPSFQQLRNLAKLYNGITLCERAWLDLVPRMHLKISLKPEYVAAGADEKDYQADISYFRAWFDSPDKMHDLHSWLRMALREQTQIDELYIYKRKTRGGGLYALELIAGDQMKPLLDDWGKTPQPPSYAYQQYPWGIPGAWFRTDEMIHYQESPAADTPYGQSRVERIIMLVNQALRKQKKDLSHFTEGNIPQGMMLVPDDATWTPDQIDAFEQAWNALLAGNAQQQVRMRFTQPGMKYQPFEQYGLDPSFDKFILNIAVSAYGMSMQDLAFTEDIHKSSGDSQQNVTYRRTIDPLAVVYASFITNCMNNDFDPDLHGEMFEASFGGYDEEEDVSELAGAYSELVTSGILGVTNAGKLLKLPDDPNAPYIGRILVTKDGPVFLDDMASDKMRNAAMQSQLAGYQQAAQPQSPNAQKQAPPKQQGNQKDDQEEPEDDEEQQPQQQRQLNKSSLYTLEDDPLEELDLPEDDEGNQDEEEDDPELALWEEEIAALLKSDQDEPFTLLERHSPGGHDHDQKTHGDASHPAYGAKHDTSPQAKQASQAAASLQPKLQAADTALQSARDALHQAQANLHNAAPADKAAARDALHQAEANLHQAAQQARDIRQQEREQRQQEIAKAVREKAEERAKIQAEKAKAKAQTQKLAAKKKAEEAKLKAQKAKAHLAKQAAAAQAKTARMAATTQKKAQAAAAKAAKQTTKAAKSQQKAALKDAKAQQKAAKTLQTLISTLGSKAQLYNALSARKISKTWSEQDAKDAQQIASDLHNLMQSVNNHTDEEDAASLVTHLTQAISSLQGQKGITPARASVLDKLVEKAQAQMSRSFLYDDLDEWEEEDEEESIGEVEEVFEEERRYTISELLTLLSQQMQEKTPDQTHREGVTRPGEGRETDQGNSHAMPSSSFDETPKNGESIEHTLTLELNRWRGRAITDAKQRKAFRGFTTTIIPTHFHEAISESLEWCTSSEDVKQVFNRAKEIPNAFGDWQDGQSDITKEILRLKMQGVKQIKWRAHPGCEHCAPNDGLVRAPGEKWPSGGYLPPLHHHCQCTYDIVDESEGAERSLQVERTHPQIALFLDLDGVLSIPNAHLPTVTFDGKEAWPIPQANFLLKSLDEQSNLQPIWLTHWGPLANAWNERVGIGHWDVCYPLSDEQEKSANQLYPDLDKKVLALQYEMPMGDLQGAIWIQDGFSPEEELWSKHAGVRLVNTNQEPIHSLLLSNSETAIKLLLEMLMGSEVAV